MNPMFSAVRIKDIPFALLFFLTFILVGGFTSWVFNVFQWDRFELTVGLPLAAVLSVAVSIILRNLIVKWVAHLDRTPAKPIRERDAWALSPIPKPRWLK